MLIVKTRYDLSGGIEYSKCSEKKLYVFSTGKLVDKRIRGSYLSFVPLNRILGSLHE